MLVQARAQCDACSLMWVNVFVPYASIGMNGPRAVGSTVCIFCTAHKEDGEGSKRGVPLQPLGQGMQEMDPLPLRISTLRLLL